MSTPDITADQQDTLEELVHDQASQDASDAINEGRHEDFLRSQGWTADQIEAAEEGDLDEIVHDAASQVASNAINAGEEWDFLLTNGWAAAAIVEALSGA